MPIFPVILGRAHANILIDERKASDVSEIVRQGVSRARYERMAAALRHRLVKPTLHGWIGS